MDSYIIQYAQHLKEQHGPRNTMMDNMVDMFMMEWGDEAKVQRILKNVKITKSPDARNHLLGAVRLLVATEPSFSVPTDKANLSAKESSSKIEHAASQLWQRASRLKQTPIHYDVVLSCLLFGEMHLAVTDTASVLQWNKGAPPAIRKRLEQIAEYTPFSVDVYDPRTGYPEFGTYGLSRYYREVETTAGRVIDDFGKPAKDALGDCNYTDEVTLCHWWDYEKRITWIDGKDMPLVEEDRDEPFLPIIAQIGEGSMLFSEPEDQRQPFLYTLYKSGLWERQNLALTALNTMVFGFAANPMYYERVSMPGKHLEVDFDTPGYRITLLPGEEFGPVAKAPIDPALSGVLEMINQKIPESTIYQQALGQPMGGTVAYSTVALLNQAGRLPLTMPQRMASNAVGRTVQTMVEWFKFNGKKHPAYDIIPGDIPNAFEVEATLEINMPQDRLQNANIASLLVKSGVTSTRWVRENVLNIGQSEDMDKEIWTEQASQAMFGQQMQEILQQAQAMQAQQQPGQPGMPPTQPGATPEAMNEQAGQQPGTPMEPQPPMPNPMQPEQGMMG